MHAAGRRSKDLRPGVVGTPGALFGLVALAGCLPPEPPFPTVPSTTTSMTMTTSVGDGPTTSGSTSDVTADAGTESTTTVTSGTETGGETSGETAGETAMGTETQTGFASDDESSTEGTEAAADSASSSTGFDGPWWELAWPCRTPFTVTPVGFLGAVTDGVVLLRVPSSALDPAFALPTGEDVRLLASDDMTALPFEVDEWDPTGESTVWLGVEALQAEVAVSGWLYYGNPEPAFSVQSLSPWSATHAVLHLGEDLRDSAENHHGVVFTDPPTTAGVVSRARQFREILTERLVRLSDSRDFDFENGFSLSFWGQVRPGNNGQRRRGFLGSSGWGLEAYDYSASFPERSPMELRLRHRCITGEEGCPEDEDDEILVSDSEAEVAVWHHYGITYSPGEMILYVDGAVAHTAPTVGPMAAPVHDLTLGTDPGVAIGLFGELDEFRFSDDAWSPERFAADYATMTQDFVTFGATECW